MTKESLELDEEDGAYNLRQTDRDGKVSEITLTERSVMILAQSTPQILASILQRRNPSPGVSAVFVSPVAQAELNTDLERTTIHLTLYQSDRTGVTYGLPYEVAAALAEALPRRVAEVGETIQNLTRQ